MPRLCTADHIFASTPNSSIAPDESSRHLAERHAVATARMRRYRARHLILNVTLGPLLPGNEISLSSPSPPNAFAFTVFRVHLNPSVRPLLPRASPPPPPPPPPPLPEGDSSATQLPSKRFSCRPVMLLLTSGDSELALGSNRRFPLSLQHHHRLGGRPSQPLR